MNKKVSTIYVKEKLLDAMNAVKEDRENNSRMTIVADLFSENLIVREGAFKYLNEFLRKYYGEILRKTARAEMSDMDYVE